MLHLFVREYRCFECGRVGKYTWERDAVCCGRPMHAGVGGGAPAGVGQRIDLVQPLDAVRSAELGGLRPGLEDVWELWLLSAHRGTAESEKIGVMGRGVLGWEWHLVAGFGVRDGIDFTREEAAARVLDIVAGGRREILIQA